MPIVSKQWGSFIHIPRTSGFWVRQVLKTLDGSAFEDGVAHGLPEHWGQYAPYWTVVRDPVYWLRSAYASRVTDVWTPYTKNVPWRSFCLLVHPYRTSEDFPWFVDQVTTELPGLVGWLFDAYTPPSVEIYVYGGNTYDKLRSIGGEPELYVPRNLGANLPDMTGELIDKIERAEKGTYERFKLPKARVKEGRECKR